MPKRKRSQSEDDVKVPQESRPGNGVVSKLKETLRTTRAEAKLHHGITLVQRALKLAAGFERQKFGRRKNVAKEKKDSKAQERIEAEYQALKTLDFHLAAQNHVHKTLLKIKSVASSPALPSSVSIGQKPANTTPALLNVTARLYKANPVQKAVSDAVDEFIKALGVHAEKKANGKAKKVALPQAALEEGISDEEDVDMADYEGRLAIASDSEEPGVSGDEKSWSGFSGSDRPQDQGSESSDEEIPDKASVPQPRPTKSAFLPTLTMGGYWSGSESEPEDEVDVAPKKNRRGQRARQQLWEKKFGKQAKHLQNGPKDDRSQGWDPRKGAQLEGDDGRARRKHGPGRHPGASSGRSASAANAIPVTKPKSRDDQGPVHPSWEAAKKAKQLSQMAAFAGKKITFD